MVQSLVFVFISLPGPHALERTRGLIGLRLRQSNFYLETSTAGLKKKTPALQM
jgi:hypothetical protein